MRYNKQYRAPSLVKKGSLCVLSGLAKADPWHYHIATLPVKCRPAKRLVFCVTAHDKSQRIDVSGSQCIRSFYPLANTPLCIRCCPTGILFGLTALKRGCPSTAFGLWSREAAAASMRARENGRHAEFGFAINKGTVRQWVSLWGVAVSMATERFGLESASQHTHGNGNGINSDDASRVCVWKYPASGPREEVFSQYIRKYRRSSSYSLTCAHQFVMFEQESRIAS